MNRELQFMNKSMLIEYQERWKAVAEVELMEQRQASIRQRWQQLNAIVRMAAGLGVLYKDEDGQVDIVRQRWNVLKDLYLAGVSRIESINYDK